MHKNTKTLNTDFTAAVISPLKCNNSRNRNFAKIPPSALALKGDRHVSFFIEDNIVYPEEGIPRS